MVLRGGGGGEKLLVAGGKIWKAAPGLPSPAPPPLPGRGARSQPPGSPPPPDRPADHGAQTASFQTRRGLSGRGQDLFPSTRLDVSAGPPLLLLRRQEPPGGGRLLLRGDRPRRRLQQAALGPGPDGPGSRQRRLHGAGGRRVAPEAQPAEELRGRGGRRRQEPPARQPRPPTALAKGKPPPAKGARTSEWRLDGSALPQAAKRFVGGCVPQELACRSETGRGPTVDILSPGGGAAAGGRKLATGAKGGYRGGGLFARGRGNWVSSGGHARGGTGKKAAV